MTNKKAPNFIIGTKMLVDVICALAISLFIGYIFDCSVKSRYPIMIIIFPILGLFLVSAHGYKRLKRR